MQARLAIVAFTITFAAATFAFLALVERNGEPAGLLGSRNSPLFAPLRAFIPPGFSLGTAHNDLRVFSLGSEALRDYEARLANNFNIVTPENACKAATIMPVSFASQNFSACDRILRFAEQHGMAFRLHTLAWGEHNPRWMADIPREEKRTALLDYIAAVLDHYRGRNVTFIDVVNEAVCDNIAFHAERQNCGPEAGGMKPGLWYPDVPDYLDLAFHQARAYAPGAKLVYNDYMAESTNDPLDPGKADRVFEVVSAALARGVPIDAVGFQFHIADMHGGHGMSGALAYSTWIDGVRANFERFAQLGVDIHVTEIDVGCSLPTLPCTESAFESRCTRNANQADVFARILDVCLDVERCTVFESWGWTDRFSWRDGSDSGASPAWRTYYDQEAFMFDAEYAPKQAAWAMGRTLAAHMTSARGGAEAGGAGPSGREVDLQAYTHGPSGC